MVQSLGFMGNGSGIGSLGFGGQSLRFRIQGLVFGVWVSGDRVQGLG